MTERGRRSLDRTATRLAIGPSALSCAGGRLIVDIDEWAVPIPRRMKGRITVDLGPVFDAVHRLDEDSRHGWRPIAPLATIEVDFERPGLSWRGRAYVDMNHGSEPLEAGFSCWTWSRGERNGATRILYDVTARSGARRTLALDYRADGRIEATEPDAEQRLPMTGWRVARSTRAEAGLPARVFRTLEDTPFYSRSILGVGDSGATIHESVDLDRFASRWVQVLLPFKMPRRAG